MAPEDRPIPPQIERFLQEYAIDLNGTAAALRAGYSERAAAMRASMTLAKPHVKKRLVQILAERMTRTHIAQDRVLEELAKLAFFDIRTLFRDDGTLKPPGEWGVAFSAAVTSVEVVELWEGTGKNRVKKGEIKKVRLADRHQALHTLAKHMGMLQERVVVSGDPSAPIQHEATVQHRLADAVAAIQLKQALG